MTPRIDSALAALRPLEWAALGLLLASALFYGLVLRPAEARLDTIERALSRRLEAARFVPVSAGQKNTAEKLGAFYAFFDRDLTYTDWLARFYDVAERTGIQAQQAEYSRTSRDPVPLVMYEVSLPVSGDYARVRAFAEGVLNAIPIASLDRISVRRRQPDQDLIDADLRFTFYVPASGASK